MFRDGEPLKLTDGKVFIDRDFAIFSHVISYLRNDLRIFDFDDPYVKNQFELELKHWGLHLAWV